MDETLKGIVFSSKKLTDMGFSFKHSLEEMLVESIETCREKGFLPVSLPESKSDENKIVTSEDIVELKTGAGLTDGMMLCKKTEPGVTGEKTDTGMPARQICA